jgi:branched-chain amino acid transport system permease protein
VTAVEVTLRRERTASLLRWLAVAGAAAVAISLPWQLDASDQSLYTLMGLYALVAIGLSLLMGFAGQVSLGQGAFYALGAYTAGMLATPEETFPTGLGWGIDPLLALIVAPVVTAVVATLVGVPLLRLRGHYLAFATLALHLIALAVITAEVEWTGGQVGLIGVPPLEVGAHELRGAEFAALVWATVAVAFVVATNLVASRAGRGLRAIAASELTAAALGVDVAGYKLRLFVLSAALAGLAGGLYTFFLLFLSPDAFPLLLSIQFVVMVVVGGLGSVPGAVVGAIAIVLLQDWLVDLGTREGMPAQAPRVLSIGVFGLILASVMLFAPRGVLPVLAGAARLAWARVRPGPRARTPTA